MPQDKLPEDAGQQRKNRRLRVALANLSIFLLLAAVTLGTWHVLSPRSSLINYFLTRNALPAVPRAPRPATLDPATFAGRAAEGYRVARERAEVLEQIPCYCGCYHTDGHQNNLDCFRDRHAANCAVCLDIALRAAALAREGYAPADIKTLIDREFAPRKSQD
ncbi:MAG: hypothetical protein HY234_02515 [Acidobacteria bacterium]|nr:hypothetical protein [Acidobacteriota bacterium]MBI3661908.1 hypothetical protein [Acidobacteriota bacterium]